MDTNEPLTDARLIELVQETAAEDLSLEQIDLLRRRLRESDELRAILIDQLHMESYLNNALTEVRVSVDTIIQRAAGRRPTFGWPLRIGFVLALALVGGLAYLTVFRGGEQRPDITGEPLATDESSDEPADGDEAPKDHGDQPGEAVAANGTTPAGDGGQAPGDASPAPPTPPPPNPMPVAQQPPAEPQPWTETLDPRRAPRGLEEVAFRALDGDGPGDLPQQELQKWFEAVPGQLHRIHERQLRRGRFSAVEGLSKLRAPWPTDGVLRLGMFEPNQVKLHLWNGADGLTLHWLNHARPQAWAAYRATREGSAPQPKTLTLVATDEGRGERSESGRFDFRWQDGALLMTRDDVLLLSAPLPQPPREVILEGTTWLSEVAMYRGEPFPVTPYESGPVVLRADQPARLAWESELSGGAEILRRTSGGAAEPGTTWTDDVAPNVRLTGAADGTVEFATLTPEPSRNDQIFIRTWLGGPGLYEVVFRVDDVTPGTGLFLAGADGKPVHQIAFLRDRRTSSTVVAPLPPGQWHAEMDVDPNYYPAPYVAPGQWLRVVTGFGTLKLWTSADGVNWGRASREPVRNVQGIPSGIGLWVTRNNEPRRIRLRHLEVRRMPALASLADEQLRRQVPDFGPVAQMTYDDWLVRVVGSRPKDVELADWRRACAAAALEGQPWSARSADLLRGLVNDVLDSSRPGEEKLRFLDEVALLYDLWGDGSARALVQQYEHVGRGLARRGSPDAFGLVARALHRAPIWTEGKLPTFSQEFATDLLVHNLFASDWPQTLAVYRRVRAWMPPGHPEQAWEYQDQYRTRVFDWAAALAAQHVPAAERHGLPLAATQRWRQPLISQLSKEGYNVMAEFEAALAGRAFEDACQVIAAAGSTGLLGLLPDAKDEGLLVSLPRAVALAMREHPQLQQTMQDRFGPVGRLRVRQAIAEADADAVQAATVQYFGTEAAAEAHRWLGDRSLAAGKFSQAAGHYRDALRTAAGALTHDVAARLSLAQTLLGEPPDQTVSSAVEIGGQRYSAGEFQSLLTELQAGRTGMASGTLVSTAAPHALAPKPAVFDAQPRARFEGDMGNNAGNGATHDVDWAARQTAVAADADTLYVSNRFQLNAYDLKTGQQRWSQQLGGEHGEAHDWRFIAMRPLPAGERVFVRRLTKTGPELACVKKADGQVVWRKRPDNHVASDPVFAGDRLLALVATAPQSGVLQVDIATFHPETGDVIAQRPLLRLNDVWSQRPPCEVVAADGRLVCAVGGSVACCDALGRPEWLRQQVWMPEELDREFHLQARQPPVVADGRVYVAQAGVKAVVCLELDTGRQLWNHPMPDVRRLLGVVSGRAVVQTGDGLEGLDARTGSTAWRHETRDQLLDGYLAGGEGGLVYTRRIPMEGEESQPALVWLDPVTGREAAHTTLPTLEGKTPRLGPLVHAGGKLLAFHAKEWKQADRDLLELAPRADSPAGPLEAVALRGWEPDHKPKSVVSTAAALPGWSLLSSQSFDGFKAADLRAELHGEQRVLHTKNGNKRPAHLLRRLDVPAGGNPRLALRVGAEPNNPWRLKVRVDGEEALTTPVDDTTTQNHWKTAEVDLRPYAGRTVWVTLTQETEDKDKVADAFWKRIELLQ